MKTKQILIGFSVVMALAAIWCGRVAWRAHYDLVTLHVRNASLADVVRSLEHQTWEKLRVSKGLDAKITLDVNNLPLGKVLDLIAEQTGARWAKTYAVYQNDNALRRLQPVFHGDNDLDSAGWTNIAPRFEGVAGTKLPSLPSGIEPGNLAGGSPDGDGGGPMIQNTEDVEKTIGGDNGGSSPPGGGGGRRVVRTVNNGSPPGEGDGSGHMIKTVMRRGSSGPGGTTTTITDGDGRVKVVQTSADGKVIKSDEWSSERLLLEIPLATRLGDSLPEKASAATAAQTASKVRGHWITYYTLDMPLIPYDPGMGEMARSSVQRKFTKAGTNDPFAGGDIRERLAAEAKQKRLEELSKSPEEQVQRARRNRAAQAPN
jgi:hypothetical protein